MNASASSSSGILNFQEKQTLNEIKNASKTPGGLDELRAETQGNQI